MKYIKLFETTAGFEAARATLDLPNVSLIEATNGINYLHYVELPHDYSNDYLTIESLEDSNKISFKTSNSSLTKTISVSIDNGETWTDKTSTTSGVTLATLNTGDKLLVKGSNTVYANISNYNYFVSSKEFNVEGNIISLSYGDNFIGQTTLDSAGYNFGFLFRNCTKLKNAEHLILPATTLVSSCYQGMFRDCTSLTTAPELPAMTLAESCYLGMFQGCTSLTIAPELPATTLAQSCYYQMFDGCSVLTTAPELPAMTLAHSCYKGMFQSCRSLTTTPELPAITLAGACYYEMFAYCTALTSAPELPATTLVSSCYSTMFSGCSALTTAPELPATILVSNCYYYMFSGCTSLNYVKCLATDISATQCTNGWFNNVKTTGTFIKNASMTSWPTGTSGIPSSWTVQDAA